MQEYEELQNEPCTCHICGDTGPRRDFAFWWSEVYGSVPCCRDEEVCKHRKRQKQEVEWNIHKKQSPKNSTRS